MVPVVPAYLRLKHVTNTFVTTVTEKLVTPLDC